MTSLVGDPSEPDSPEEAALDVLHLVPKGRAAVLGAEEITYHGSIKPEAGVCWVSFPGKFKSGWDALVAERHGDSVACVFLCKASDGLGQHDKDPDGKDGCCYCPRIYGERDYKTFGYLHNIKKERAKCTEKEIDMIYEKAKAMNAAVAFADDSPKVKQQREEEAEQSYRDCGKTAAWGCRWYVVWLERVEEAAQRKQRLKVVFFPNEVDKGYLPMKDLPTSNLWDGVGCGGSQKCEIATIKAMGWEYDGVDVSLFLREQFKENDVVEFLDGGYWRKGPILEVNAEEVKWRVRCNFSGRDFWADHVRPSEADDLLKAIGGSTQELEQALQSFDLKVTSFQEARLRDGKASVGMKVEITSIKQVHQLRDIVLSGDLDTCLNAAIAKMDPNCQELVVEKREFFDFYESTILSFTEFTPHQLEKLAEMESANTDLHLQAPAGAGKTFVAVQYMRRMMRASPTSSVCYVAPSQALAFFVLRWLVLVAPSTVSSIFSKMTVLHAPYEGFLRPVADGPRISLKPVKKPPEISLLVVDEAHKVTAEHASVWELPAKQRLVLSDLSQSRNLQHFFPDMRTVQLAEVIRGSQRITAAARTFQLSGAARSVSAVGTDGPPVKTYIFDTGESTDPLDEYISQIMKALWYVVETLPTGLSLHGRVALLVPGESFRTKLEAPLQKRLAVEFSPRNIRLASSVDFWQLLPAHLMPLPDTERPEEFVILDTIDNSTGLEHLVVVCVGLDEVLGATDQDTRARLYVGLTRAQLLAVVVNEYLPGSWLQFVTTLRLDKRFQKHLASAEIRKRAATEVVTQPAPRVTSPWRRAGGWFARVRMPGLCCLTPWRPRKVPRIPDAVSSAAVVPPAAASEPAAEEQRMRGTCVWDTDENEIRTKTTKLLFDPRLSAAEVMEWKQLQPTANSPSERQGHSAVYNPESHSMLIFGGFNGRGVLFSDVWALDLKVVAWKQLQPTGTSPSTRCQHSAIYNPESHSMLIFGGDKGRGKFSDVWALDLKVMAWKKLQPTGRSPSERHGHSAVYDPESQSMLIFGGDEGIGSVFSDVWALDLKVMAWKQLQPTGTSPSARVFHSAVYDPESQSMLIFGGEKGEGEDRSWSDVWALDLKVMAWKQLQPTGTSPSARHTPSAIYEPESHSMLIFGGFNDYGPEYFSDVWALDLKVMEWKQLQPTGKSPSERQGHSAVYDPESHSMLIFGGMNSGREFSSDVWALELEV